MSGPTRFALPAAVVRGSLDGLREALVAALADGGGVIVDAASVLELDGPGVQFLLALAKEARERGVPFELVDRSRPLAAALAASRVDGLLP